MHDAEFGDEVKSQGMAMPLNTTNSFETKPLPTFDVILGSGAAELEDKENPVQPGEATRDDFCYICEAQTTATFSLLQGAPVTEPIEFIVNYIAPFFASKSIDVIIRSIRAYYNTVIRPHMAPGFKQRWTRRQIFIHFFDHCKEYTSVLMRRACRDIMIKSIETGITFNPECPRDEKVTKDLVPTLLRLYGIIKEKD
jgi:hypothetical protein